MESFKEIKKRLIRKEFDSLTGLHQHEECLQLIELAKSEGFQDLAEEMKNDL